MIIVRTCIKKPQCSFTFKLPEHCVKICVLKIIIMGDGVVDIYYVITKSNIIRNTDNPKKNSVPDDNKILLRLAVNGSDDLYMEQHARF